MNISNDIPPTDFVDYFTKQLPIDLANMAALRDELAKRQGAMSAVEASLADRAKAADELAAAKAQAKDIDAKAKKKQADLAAREAAVAAAEKRAAETAAALEGRERNLAEAETKLAADRAAFDEKFKEFQAKVASITA